MKYVLLFAHTMTQEERDTDPAVAERYERTNRWFADYSQAGKVLGGEELRAPDTATTVRFKDGKPVVTDGPFIEAKEIVGGFALVDVADLDEALAMAKAWPAGAVEIRPVVEH